MRLRLPTAQALAAALALLVAGCGGASGGGGDVPPPPSKQCGNGQLDVGEACDGSCPVTCDDGNSCTEDTSSGSPATCDRRCASTPVTTCRAGDGCCPAGCDSAADSDCPPPPGCTTNAECPDRLAEPACSGLDVVRDRFSRECVQGACADVSVETEPLQTCAGETWCRAGACAPLWAGLHGGPVDATRGLRILFIGNSFTFMGPIPTLVGQLAGGAGWPQPTIEYHAVGGATLTDHKNNPAALALVDQGAWDSVILQDYSTRPTDAAGVGGNPAGFKADATWFYDRIKATSPQARVILYETWARHPVHPYYPTYYASPTEMQAQLRYHYNDAAEHYVPSHASAAPITMWVAPVGDAWERHLSGPSPLRLHYDDDYHAGVNGQYLDALVLYTAIYNCATTGLAPLLSIPSGDAARLQADADATTGAPLCSGRPSPMPFALLPWDLRGLGIRAAFGALAR